MTHASCMSLIARLAIFWVDGGILKNNKKVKLEGWAGVREEKFGPPRGAGGEGGGNLERQLYGRAEGRRFSCPSRRCGTIY